MFQRAGTKAGGMTFPPILQYLILITMTKSKSQTLYVVRIQILKSSPTSLIPGLWNIGVLLHKQARCTSITGHPDQTFWKPVQYMDGLFIYCCKYIIFSQHSCDFMWRNNMCRNKRCLSFCCGNSTQLMKSYLFLNM